MVRLGEWAPPDAPIVVQAELGDLQEALGALLAAMQVGRQMRAPSASVSMRVPRPWWWDRQHLRLKVTVPRQDVIEHLDEGGQLREGAGLKILQSVLQTEAARDALCVALALRVDCKILVNVRGVTDCGVFSVSPPTGAT